MYQFEGYTFRPAIPSDKPLARLWNTMDPEHKWEMQFPDYWIEQTSQINCYVLEDSIGILFFVKSIRHADNEIEITLQFDRECGTVSKARVIRGLASGFEWLREALPMNGFKRLYFLSKNDDLIAFTEKRLGFVKEEGRYIRFFGGSEDGEDSSKENEEGQPGQSRIVDLASRTVAQRNGYTGRPEDTDGAKARGVEVKQSAGAA